MVIAVFEPTIAAMPILAALMPVAAGLGGNTAIQSLTIVTRGLAIGDFDYISYTKATLKEISVGVALGATAGLVALLIVYSWKEAFYVGGVLGLSIVINSFVAAFLGTLVPIIMKSLNKDPAVGSGVLVTTLSDLFCFFSFLGLARLLL
jgi:magnesium transporter